MTKFTVARILDNSRSHIIGYQVISQCGNKGDRTHGSQMGGPVLVPGAKAAKGERNTPGKIASLERAKIAMEERAAALQIEADANRARG